MTDIIKILLITGIILGICAAAEWLAEHAPWFGIIGIAALFMVGIGYLFYRIDN